MYDRTTIETEFMSLAGFRQNDDPTFENFSSSLLYDGDNLEIQHPVINIEVLDMVSRNYNHYGYDAYNIATTYNEGDRMKFSNQVYESLEDGNTGNTPNDSGSEGKWELVPKLSLYLESVARDSVNYMMTEFTNHKKLSKQVKTMIDNVVLFEGAGHMNNLITNKSNWLVGFQIRMKYSRNILAMVERIMTQFSEAGDLTLYVHHSSQRDPIATLVLTRTKPISAEWHTLTTAQKIKMYYILDQYDAGGNILHCL